MTTAEPEDRAQPSGRADDVRRIEEARDEAAAYVVQQAPVGYEGASAGISKHEERLVEAVQASHTETDPEKLDKLAEEAEEQRDEIRRELYGEGTSR